MGDSDPRPLVGEAVRKEKTKFSTSEVERGCWSIGCWFAVSVRSPVEWLLCICRAQDLWDSCLYPNYPRMLLFFLMVPPIGD